MTPPGGRLCYLASVGKVCLAHSGNGPVYVLRHWSCLCPQALVLPMSSGIGTAYVLRHWHWPCLCVMPMPSLAASPPPAPQASSTLDILSSAFVTCTCPGLCLCVAALSLMPQWWLARLTMNPLVRV